MISLLPFLSVMRHEYLAVSLSIVTVSSTPFLDNTRAMLLVLLLANPHLMERAQRSQHTTTDPSTVLPVCCGTGCVDSYPRIWEHGAQLALDTLGHFLDQAAATGEDDLR